MDTHYAVYTPMGWRVAQAPSCNHKTAALVRENTYTGCGHSAMPTRSQLKNPFSCPY